DGRLPMAVVPQRYELLLTVEPDRGEFSGSVAVRVQVREPVRAITLHAWNWPSPALWWRPAGLDFRPTSRSILTLKRSPSRRIARCRRVRRRSRWTLRVA